MSGPPDYIIKKKNRTAYSNQPFTKKRGYVDGSRSQGPNSRRPQGSNSTTQIIKKETLYLGEHDLGDGPYAVEIIIAMTNDLVVSAQHMQGPESFIIEIEAPKVDALVNEFGGDLAYLAQHLKLMNKRMVLLNPVSYSFSISY